MKKKVDRIYSSEVKKKICQAVEASFDAFVEKFGSKGDISDAEMDALVDHIDKLVKERTGIDGMNDDEDLNIQNAVYDILNVFRYLSVEDRVKYKEQIESLLSLLYKHSFSSIISVIMLSNGMIDIENIVYDK